MSSATKILSRFKTTVRESASLLSSLISKPATSTYIARTVLLRHAQTEQNSVAAFVLRLDREMNLARYHGVGSYFRRTIEDGSTRNLFVGRVRDAFRFNSSTDTRSFGSDNNSKDPRDRRQNNKTAKVAFMITSAQRERLALMGYEPPQIKHLTPLEAVLVIENDLVMNSENSSDILKRLVRDYHKEQKETAEKVLEDASSEKHPIVEEEFPVEILEPPSHDSNETANTKRVKVAFMITSAQRECLAEMGYEPFHIKELTPLEATLVIENNLRQDGENSSDMLKALVSEHQETQRRLAQEALQAASLEKLAIVEIGTEKNSKPSSSEESQKERCKIKHSLTVEKDNEWFEVMEIMDKGEPSVVALFRNQEEAESCREIKEEFGLRKAKDFTYTVRRREIE